MERQDKKLNLERANLLLTGVTLMVIVGGWLWWGGRLSARVDNLEGFKAATEKAAERKDVTDSRQTSAIAVTNAQFAQIASQLNRLESKVDVLR